MFIGLCFLFTLGVYELWSLNSSNFVGRGIKDIKSSLEAIQSDDTSSTLCGSFRSTFGPLGSIFFLWRHTDFDTAEQMRLLWISNQGKVDPHKNVHQKFKKCVKHYKTSFVLFRFCCSNLTSFINTIYLDEKQKSFINDLLLI